jgi:hypothetical protein
MLAAAAVVAAALAGMASLRSEAAFDALQRANRDEVKHAAALLEDVRFVYADEGPSALRALEARIRAEELRGQAEDADGDVRTAILLEARVAQALADTLTETGFDLGTAEYRTEDGGLDIARRLADARARNPDLLALDPQASQARGERLGREAALGLASTVPVGVAFLFGALGQAHPHRRRPLTLLGWTFIAVAVVLGAMAMVV